MADFKVDEDSAKVRFPPPLMVLIAVLFGASVHWLFPFPLGTESFRWPLGSVVVVAGISLILYSAKLFQKAQTRIEPWKVTSSIVQTGVFGRSRNPIYLAFLIVSGGVAILADSLWIALSIVPSAFMLETFVIQKEEKYLEEKFGKEYLDYKSRVRRWL